MIASNRPVGSCMLAFDDIHRFPDDERGLLTALGGLIAQALERARLHDAAFVLARGSQDALLPTLPGLRVTWRHLPGTRGMDIGGDWHDVIPIGDEVALIIGDAERHNVAAAAATSQLRSAMRAFVTAGHRPSDVVASTHLLHMDLDPALHALFHPGSGGVRIVRSASRQCPTARRRELHLASGSVLALHTDGLLRDACRSPDAAVRCPRSSGTHPGSPPGPRSWHRRCCQPW
ncbi:hypothetical protein QF037_001799 [Streptomyces canus]|uniref:PP2C family protein-serine/threonine phosphatase n=1 Tax=Streptomyces canus TaxID=58343 RepID=UPI00277E9EFC|nr:SpoIIE family protein phosphatase [Streptomyces canus]MDQ0597454.1 hypothetical protein [Streptomyces canus]